MNHIINRTHAGVSVRLIVDPRANPSYAGNEAILNAFRQAGIPMIVKAGGGIMHWKTMLFAGQSIVEFGSANFAPPAFVPIAPYTNYVAETVFFDDDPVIVNSFKRKFDDLWTDTSHYGSYANVTARVRAYALFDISPEMNFPPGQSYAGRVLALERAETSALDIDMYRISQQQHSDAIIAAHMRGVPIRYIGETREYRNAKGLWVAYNMDRLYHAGVPMRVRANAGENHEKVVLLHGQAVTVFGSSNFTRPSDNSQQEHNYFTHNNAIFLWFLDQFNRRWYNAAGYTETMPFVPSPPDTPKNLAVPNLAVGVPISGQQLVWHGGPWTIYYDVCLGTDPAASTRVASNLALGPSLTTSQHQHFVLPTLQPSTTYYWKIMSRTAASLSKTGATWSFTTAP